MQKDQFEEQNFKNNIHVTLTSLQRMEKMVLNPALKTKINDMCSTIIWLSENIDKEVKFRKSEMKERPVRKKNKKQSKHFPYTCKSLFNPQGGFGKNASYHIKGYED